MAKTVCEWLETEVSSVRGQPWRWLSEQHFFRDPVRPMYADPSYFFSPADGIILYQERVPASAPLVDIKGVSLSLREAMRLPWLEGEYLVIGIFMTVYDVHVNRIPYAGILNHRWLPPLETLNRPMLPVETCCLEQAGVWRDEAEYLRVNERVLNRVMSGPLQAAYYILQIADYDVRCIVPFERHQNCHFAQNRRFSQIRFGSQVDLILPLSGRHRFETVHEVGTHVEAGIDPLVKVVPGRPLSAAVESVQGRTGAGGPPADRDPALLVAGDVLRGSAKE
jgi:phosphatidylserine decarboxylase